MEHDFDTRVIQRCSGCGQAMEPDGRDVPVDKEQALCDRCYMRVLAPDHRARAMEMFD